MIRYDSIPYWPEDVYLDSNGLKDETLDTLSPMNEISYIMLKEIDHQKNIGQIAEIVCNRYDWPLEQVKPDVLELIHQLNQGYLINIQSPRSMKQKVRDRFISLLYFLRTFQGTRWNIRKRIGLDKNRSFWKLFWQIAISVSRVMVMHVFLLSIVLYFIFTFLQFPAMVGAIIFFIGLISGFILHEYGHVATFYLLASRNQHAFFALKRGTFQVIKKELDAKKECWVTLMGPLLPTIVGGIMFCILFAVGDIPNWISWMASGLFTFHLVWLLPIFVDGKKLWSLLRMKPEKKLEKGKGEKTA
ncbi:PqqD family protein [Hazenella sp. IB182353]|uniref:PqqD family protein n=1 Tax=Polycladospora coralii TaxID=2771432 RepID=UPI001745C529|nr:PqqD family protein [Polycladospora coralii]MBS7530407.1 PqqD family protein [Polycladospora coralii]